MLSSGGGKLSLICGRGAANDSGLPRPSPSEGGARAAAPHCEIRWGRVVVLKGRRGKGRNKDREGKGKGKKKEKKI